MMHETACPEALQDIIEEFSSASPEERLELLLEFAMELPDLPEELHNARDTMEQVHECQSPVFLHASLKDGRVVYHIDVPREAPTVRGFASVLCSGLNGATPAAVAATPTNLYQQLGLHKVISPLRLRGLAALLGRMKRNAEELAVSSRPD
jgi:cysteine desulfuration protein SufE